MQTILRQGRISTLSLEARKGIARYSKIPGLCRADGLFSESSQRDVDHVRTYLSVKVRPIIHIVQTFLSFLEIETYLRILMTVVMLGALRNRVRSRRHQDHLLVSRVVNSFNKC